MKIYQEHIDLVTKKLLSQQLIIYYQSLQNMNKESASKVLLLCIYDTVVFELTNQMIYQTFKDFASIKKVLIFQRGQMTKCFIQLSSEEEAARVKDLMDGKKMFQTYCKMHIYFSTLKEIDLKNQYSKGKDFSSSSTSLLGENTNLKTMDDFYFPTYNYYQELKRSKTTDQNDLMKAINEENNYQMFSERIKSDIIENILEQSIPLPLQMPPKTPFVAKNQSYLTAAQLENSYLGLENRTQVISFAYQNALTLSEVYNLFSNFGNIQKIVKKNTKCYVEFTNIEFAAIAKDYLNGMVIYGNLLQVGYVDRKQLIEKPRQYTESIVYDSTFYRFNSKKSISINPPSNILHVSNMKKQICAESKLKSIFEQYGKIEKIQILVQSKQKNMALVKYANLEDSINGIASLHNREISGRKLQISFTKSKI